MTVSSLQFLFGLWFLSAIFPHIPLGRARRLVLAVCNAVFLVLLMPNAGSWIVLAVFLLSGYVVAMRLRARPSRLGLAVYLGALVSSFMLLQKYVFLGILLPEKILQHPIAIIGLSYMLFRQIHFIVDAMQGQIEQTDLWSYLNYQLNLFGLLAGPIQRYQSFRQDWQSMTLPVDRHELLRTHARILLGVIKIAGMAVACLFVYDKVVEQLLAIEGGPNRPGRASVLLEFATVFYLYPAYVYFNFSGYCDIVIGGAALLGIRLPENFDRPYLGRNMIDYWNRWHRTLSFWIRDYIFTPLYKTIAEKTPRRAPSLAFLCYFIALFIAGVWHGSTLNWVIFGLLNGLGVAAAKLWENYLIRRRGRAGLRKYLASRRIRAAAIVANIHFACFTILFFPAGLDRCFQILRSTFVGLRG